MAFSLTTLDHKTAAIASTSNSASPPIFNPYHSSQLSSSPPLMRFGFRSTFDFSCVLAKQSTRQVVSSALRQPESFADLGKCVPETLKFVLSELESAFKALPSDHEFQKEYERMMRNYVCKESPLVFAERLTEHYKRPNGEGPEIYLKSEDLKRRGLHRINNAVAQALLAKKLGKTRIVTEAGVGEHGVATATICERYGLQCVIYMGVEDIERQGFNLYTIMQCGAEVIPVPFGRATLIDATLYAIRDWVNNVETTHYMLGSAGGPHPYPMMVREFHSVIGKETRKQAMEKWGGKPDVLVSCVEGESNAMGLFHEFVEDKEVRLIGVEGEGLLLNSRKHTEREIGVFNGEMRYMLQDDGSLFDLLSVTAGQEYPEHILIKDLERAELYSITDEEALEAFKRLKKCEAIMPGLEASHAVAYLEKLCPTLANGTKVVLNCSSRGKKDYATAFKYFEV